MRRSRPSGRSAVRMNRVKRDMRLVEQVKAEHARLAELLGLSLEQVQFLLSHLTNLEFSSASNKHRHSAIRARAAFNNGEALPVIAHITAQLKPTLAARDENYKTSLYDPLVAIKDLLKKKLPK